MRPSDWIDEILTVIYCLMEYDGGYITWHRPVGSPFISVDDSKLSDVPPKNRDHAGTISSTCDERDSLCWRKIGVDSNDSPDLVERKSSLLILRCVRA